MSSDRTVLHSDIRKIKCNMARHNWAMITWLVLGVNLIKCAIRLDLRLVW